MIGEMGNGSGYDYDLSAFKTRKGRKKRQITRRSNVFAEIHNYLDISETIEKLARLFLYADFKEELLQLLLENPRKQKNLVAYIQAGYPDLLWKRRGGDGQIKLTKQEKAALKFVAKFMLEARGQRDADACFSQYEFHDMSDRSKLGKVFSGRWIAKTCCHRGPTPIIGYDIVANLTYQKLAARVLEMDEDTLPAELERRLIKYGYTLTVAQFDELARLHKYEQDAGVLAQGSTAFIEDDGHVYPTKLQFLANVPNRVWKHAFTDYFDRNSGRLLIAHGPATNL